TDTKDRIETILIKCKGNSLHEYNDSNDPFHSFINFDLSRERFDKIEPKLIPKEIQNLLCHIFKEKAGVLIGVTRDK
ncbi:3253_t:CDS:2, partial [Scutellospora calospora]